MNIPNNSDLSLNPYSVTINASGYNYYTGSINISYSGVYNIVLNLPDTTPPNINITFPLNTTYTLNISELNYTTEDDNLQACWYSYDNGNTNYSIACRKNITNLTSNYGTNIWGVYSNDSAGNIGWSFVTFFLSQSLSIPENLSLPAGSGSGGAGGSTGGGAGSAGSQGIIAGSSSASCNEECKENEEEGYCSENKTITKTCGNFDADRCLEFDVAEDYCDEGEQCVNGVCIGKRAKAYEGITAIESIITGIAGRNIIARIITLIVLIAIIIALIYLIRRLKKIIRIEKLIHLMSSNKPSS